eukprot:4794569-Heterocapsa_arctica.AAC.1
MAPYGRNTGSSETTTTIEGQSDLLEATGDGTMTAMGIGRDDNHTTDTGGNNQQMNTDIDLEPGNRSDLPEATDH